MGSLEGVMKGHDENGAGVRSQELQNGRAEFRLVDVVSSYRWHWIRAVDLCFGASGQLFHSVTPDS
jgi:hypothetical protein